MQVCKGEALNDALGWFYKAGFIGYIQAWFDFPLHSCLTMMFYFLAGCADLYVQDQRVNSKQLLDQSAVRELTFSPRCIGYQAHTV